MIRILASLAIILASLCQIYTTSVYSMQAALLRHADELAQGPNKLGLQLGSEADPLVLDYFRKAGVSNRPLSDLYRLRLRGADASLPRPASAPDLSQLVEEKLSKMDAASGPKYVKAPSQPALRLREAGSPPPAQSISPGSQYVDENGQRFILDWAPEAATGGTGAHVGPTAFGPSYTGSPGLGRHLHSGRSSRQTGSPASLRADTPPAHLRHSPPSVPSSPTSSVTSGSKVATAAPSVRNAAEARLPKHPGALSDDGAAVDDIAVAAMADSSPPSMTGSHAGAVYHSPVVTSKRAPHSGSGGLEPMSDLHLGAAAADGPASGSLTALGLDAPRGSAALAPSLPFGVDETTISALRRGEKGNYVLSPWFNHPPSILENVVGAKEYSHRSFYHLMLLAQGKPGQINLLYLVPKRPSEEAISAYIRQALPHQRIAGMTPRQLDAHVAQLRKHVRFVEQDFNPGKQFLTAEFIKSPQKIAELRRHMNEIRRSTGVDFHPELINTHTKSSDEQAAALLGLAGVSETPERLISNRATGAPGLEKTSLGWGGKWGSRMAFEKAGVSFPKGTVNLHHNLDSLAGELADLVKREGNDRWVLKLDQGASGTGNHDYYISKALERQGESRPVSALSTAELADVLRRDLPTDLKADYKALVPKEGILAEAFVLGAEASPSAQFTVTRRGGRSIVRIESTHDQILHGDEYLGGYSPSKYDAIIREEAEKIARHYESIGWQGHAGIDFLVVPDGRRGYKTYAIEVNGRVTGTTHPNEAARIVMGGKPLHEADRHYMTLDNVQLKTPTKLLKVDGDEILRAVRETPVTVPEHRLADGTRVAEAVRTLEFDPRTGTGNIPHLTNLAKRHRKIGNTAVGRDRAEAELYMKLLEEQVVAPIVDRYSAHRWSQLKRSIRRQSSASGASRRKQAALEAQAQAIATGRGARPRSGFSARLSRKVPKKPETSKEKARAGQALFSMGN